MSDQANITADTQEKTSPQCPLQNAEETAVAESPIAFKQVKATLLDEFSTSAAIGAYLKAIGAGNDCLALYRINATVIKMANNYLGEALLPRPKEWLAVFSQVDQDIDNMNPEEGWAKEKVALYSPVADTAFSGMYRAIAFVSRMEISPPLRAGLDQMTAALIMSAASNNLILSEAVGNGIRQCYRALAGTGMSSWRTIATEATIDCEKLKRLKDPAHAPVINEFLRSCTDLLAAELRAPGHIGPNSHAISRLGHASSFEVEKPTLYGHTVTRGTSTRPTETNSEETPQVVTAPSISSMVRAAQIAPLATKAGVVYQWDFHTPRDLAILTRKLANAIFDQHEQRSAFATLALASLELRANAKSALLVSTEAADADTRGDLWLDIARGCKSWMHSAYTTAVRPDLAADRRKGKLRNDIPLSTALHRGLKRHTRNSGVLPTLKNSLAGALQGTENNLKVYNQFLRDMGDQAHMAEPSRFAHSLGAAFLTVTGSDMLAAFCALNFEVAAPSALFYYSPRTQFVHQECDRVYKYLGLEGAVPIHDMPSRLGAQP